MSGVTIWLLGGAALWLIVLGVAVSEIRKGIRDRRLDREARQRRDRQAALLEDVEDTLILLGQRVAGRGRKR